MRFLVLLSLTWLPALSVPDQEPAPAPALRALPDRLISETDERPLALLRQDFLLPVLETELEAMKLELQLLAAGEDSERKQRIEASQHEIRLLHTGLSREQEPSTMSAGTLPLIDQHLYGFARDHLNVDPIDVRVFESWRAANQEFLEAQDLQRRDRAIELRQQALSSWPNAPLLLELIGSLERGALTQSERRDAVEKLGAAYPEIEFPSAEMLSQAGRQERGAKGPGMEYTPDPSLPRIDGSEHPSKIVESLSKLYEEVTAR